MATTERISVVEKKTRDSTLLGNLRFVTGLSLLAVIGLAALAGNVTLGPSTREAGAFLPRLAPGAGGLLGTTSLGQSVAAQLAQAVPTSMEVGFIAATLGTVLGAILGFTSGYFGRLVDFVLRVFIDVSLSIPTLLFLLLIASLMKGIDVPTMALIIGLFSWAWPARQIRAQVLSFKERLFVAVARLSGMSGPEIIVRELMPLMLPWLGANFVNAFITAVLAESGLSILGLGPRTGVTLGIMIYWALSYNAIFLNLWWWWIPPVVTLTLLFLSLYLVHLGLDEVSNPRLRRYGREQNG